VPTKKIPAPKCSQQQADTTKLIPPSRAIKERTLQTTVSAVGMVVHERFQGPIVRVRILEPGPQSGCAPGRPGKESSKLPGVGGVLDRVLKQTEQCGRFSKDPTLRLSDADITEAQINQFVFLQQEVGFAALCLDVIVVAHLYGIDLTDAQ
jgi:hypothetical protein